MKKIFAIIMAICLLASALCITAFAADPTPGTVLRISAIDSDGDTVFVADHTNFEDGWNAAMKLANDMEDYDYTRVIVDIYADWNADIYGDFTEDWRDGDGFDNDTIYFNDDVRMTLNMNGHTINRNLSSFVGDGEVMYIDTDADVIINNGTIKGGRSNNGAGGIHIKDGANVTLNNVNIVDNTVITSDGAGIALYDDATLTMNGGSLRNNEAKGVSGTNGVAVYVNDSTAIFKNVEFKNNQGFENNHYGAAIYATDSTVTMEECIVDGNGIENAEKRIIATVDTIHAKNSSINVKKSTFINNGYLHYVSQGYGIYNDVSTLFYLDDSSLVMDGCGVTENTLGYLIQATDNSEFFVSGTNMTRNTAIVLKSTGHSIGSYFNGCTFGNNITSSYTGEKYPFLKYSFSVKNPVTFYNCNMGNSTYSNPANIKFINQNLDSGVVLTISGRKVNGTVVKIEEHRSFETGWAAAMELAIDSYWMSMNAYEYVVVDMHVDWIASNGRFTDSGINGIGFNSDTIYVSEGACLILNMNGYKIDRGLSAAEDNGEVIYIASDADIIINDGTITGGYSDNGAGGIHISGEAKLTLNNVHVDGNRVDDDDGAAIALYGATLIMNGGSISNNEMRRTFKSFSTPYGTLYLNDATAYLKDVEFINNAFSGNDSAYGVAIYVEESNLVAENCTFKGNGNKKLVYQGATPSSIICIDEGSMEFINCVFEDNGTPDTTTGPEVIELWGGTVKVSNSIFRNNISSSVIWSYEGILQVSDSRFEGNTCSVFCREVDEGSYFKNCTFSGNTTNKNFKTFEFDDDNKLNFENCDFGDSTFNDRSLATFDGKAVASIFGEGSLAMIVSLVALIASVAAIVVNVSSKKKAVPAIANNEAESGDEE